jgi:hypothetical protein
LTTPATRSRHAAGRALKSPLAAPGTAAASHDPGLGSLASAPGRAALTDRGETLAEFQGYLRTVNNRDGRPYEEKTITAYSDPVKSLDRWMTANGIDGDFTVVDTAMLNRYFREYYLEHARAGRTPSSVTSSSCSTSWSASGGSPPRTRTGSTGMRRSRGARRRCPVSSSMTCLRSPEAGGRGTSRQRAITRSSASCAARASAGWNYSVWSCTPCRRT